MKTTQYKKELLYRKANGKLFLEDYKYKIDSLFLIDTNALCFIGLEDTDDILSSSNDVDTTDERIRLSSYELGGLLKKMKKDNSSYYVFIDEDWKCCGSFVIPSLHRLNEGFMFGDKIINDVLFIDKDFKKIISFDYFEINGEYFIDVVVSVPV